MTGYIIGLIIGVIIFVTQNIKPTSFGFRIFFLILTVAFLWGVSYLNAGYWNVLIMPVGVFVLCFIAAMCFPYRGSSSKNEYMVLNGQNYYDELNDDDIIGSIDVPGFKQTYDRIIYGILFELVGSQNEIQRIGSLLYSKNFYPISTHTKREIMQHINSVTEEILRTSEYKKTIKNKVNKNIGMLFNAYVSVMSIHEDATRSIDEIMKTK